MQVPELTETVSVPPAYDGNDSATTEVTSDEEVALAASVPESPSSGKIFTNSGNKFSHTILLMFSGPRYSSGSLKEQLEEFGLTVEDYDVVNGQGGDLSDDMVWDPLLDKLEVGSFSVVIASPPCCTFSRSDQYQEVHLR